MKFNTKYLRGLWDQFCWTIPYEQRAAIEREVVKKVNDWHQDELWSCETMCKNTKLGVQMFKLVPYQQRGVRQGRHGSNRYT